MSIIIWGLLFSSAGIGYFVYGRRQGRKIALYAGVGLMVIPYITSGTLPLILVGASLMVLPFVIEG